MYTAADAIEHLSACLGGSGQDHEHRLLRNALFNAYRDVITARDWRWHHASTTISILSTDTTKTSALPWGVQSIDAVYMPSYNAVGAYVEPHDWQRLVDSDWQPSSLLWTVLPSSTKPADGYYSLHIYNGIAFSGDFTFTYRRRPRDLRYTGFESNSRVGSLATYVAASGTFTATGTSTAFDSNMIGAVLRVANNTTYHPEGLAGVRPYSSEGLITAVGGATACSGRSGDTYTASAGAKYIVTDVLDISPSMYTAVLAAAEAGVARMRGANNAGDLVGLAARELRMAFEADHTDSLAGSRNYVSASDERWQITGDEG